MPLQNHEVKGMEQLKQIADILYGDSEEGKKPPIALN
ncbi:MAG: arsenical pump-driving ATPase GET3 [Methanobacterium paludis]|nr:arsenical pump-driving ATPase GET3 [Methanobacterium paludis]